ncbi:MAG: AMP-dependent synthetase [Rhodospirillaceae bacterium]|nr:AMP-dependent synthetase [Rhodospirillaceae bacterium]
MSQITATPLTIPDVVSRYAEWQPDDEAVICDDLRLTWSDFVAAYHQVANALIARGLNKGDKICLLTRSGAEMLILIFGVVKAGGIIVPLSPLFEEQSVARMIQRSEARFLFATKDNRAKVDAIHGDLGDLLTDALIAVDFDADGWTSYSAFLGGASADDPGIPLSPDDDFNIMYTSGTTGDPKGMVHSHQSRLLYPLGWGTATQIGPGATVLLTTPLYHNGTWITMLPALHHGGKVIIMTKFNASDFLRLVQDEKVTHTFAVPTQLIVSLELSDFDIYDTRALQVILTGGSPLPTTTFDETRQRFPHTDLMEIYGMSEGFATMVGPGDYARGKAGSVGRPIRSVHTDVKLVGADNEEARQGEIGEIVGISALAMKEYYKDPERTEETLWRDESGRAYLRSGDLGRIDKDGYVYVVGRTKDMVISGGVNIFPIDIEEVFMQHPEILEVAVIGIPHDKWGETPLLLALMRDSAEVSETEVMEWGNQRLAKYQRVFDVEFRDNFPRNAFDKIMKRELREPYWEGRDSDIV